MAITDYATLQAAIQDYADNDALTDARVQLAIQLAEGEINQKLTEGLEAGRKIRPMVTRSDITVDAEYETIPTSPSELALPISLEITSITDQPWRVTYVDPDAMVQMKQREELVRSELEQLLNLAAAPPKHYTIVGTEFRFFPDPEASYTVEFTRYCRLPALSDSNTANWLLTAFPNVYLYASLAQAMAWDVDGNAETWDSAFQRAMVAVLNAYPVPTSGARLRMDDMPTVGRRTFC
jgi:hypothetical protein